MLAAFYGGPGFALLFRGDILWGLIGIAIGAVVVAIGDSTP